MFNTRSRRLITVCKTHCKLIQRNMSIRLFESSDHAKYYAQFRPDYPDSVVRTIVDYYASNNTDTTVDSGHGTAVDVGCGSGQSTYPLRQHFNKVIGMDVSEKQIEHAKKKYSDVEFRVGPGENLQFLENCSINLITTAQALHWMNHDAFYREVDRVLKPGGTLAVYGYGMPQENKIETHILVSELYSHTLGGLWDKKRKMVEEHYKSVQLPFHGWIRNDDLEIIKHWTVDQYIGYITSWSACQEYLKVNPGSTALQTLYENLLELYPNDELITIRWPIFMLLGTKPK